MIYGTMKKNKQTKHNKKRKKRIKTKIEIEKNKKIIIIC